MTKFEALLDQANQRLSRVKIRVRGQKLSIRGRFPPKPGDGYQIKQYDVSTGYRAIPRELSLAEGMAKQMDADLLLQRFDWTPYLKGQQRIPQSVGEWIAKLEQDYWSRRTKTLNTNNTWEKSYKIYYKKLPPTAPLTVALLRDVILSETKPATRSRERICASYRMLGKFAGLDVTELQGFDKGYEQKPIASEQLPSDEEILELIDAIPNRGWQWIAGIMATFGLRNHEVFTLDTSRICEGVVRVGEETKTGTRLVYACPFEWVERWQLHEVLLPNVNIQGKSNDGLGSRVYHQLKKYGLPSPYRLRDSYAIRLALNGVDLAIAAQWMGHSVGVHSSNYLDAIQERHHQIVFNQLKLKGKKLLQQ